MFGLPACRDAHVERRPGGQWRLVDEGQSWPLLHWETLRLSCPIVAAKVPAKISLPARPTAPPVFRATIILVPQESIEHGTKVGLYHVEFLGADRHHIWQVIDDMRDRGRAVLRDMLCVSRSFLQTPAHRPRGLCGDAASAKAFAAIGVRPYPVGLTAGRSWRQLSTAGAENTGQTQLNAADAKRIWPRMVEKEFKKPKSIRLLCKLPVPAGLYQRWMT